MPEKGSESGLLPPSTVRIGVDTGGTFTDFIALAGAHFSTFKIPSTPQAPAVAILAGIRRILATLETAGISSGNIEIAHGTTVATNTLLERTGARTALITTAGFEDVIEIGRQARPDLYNLAGSRPAALVPRTLRFGIRERLTADGTILEAADPGQISRLAGKLRRAGVESVAISLLFSFANAAHERAVIQSLEAVGIPLTASHQILPEYREYERTSTVVINAYLLPRVGQYIKELREGIETLQAKSGIRQSSLRVMQSSGGSISAEVAGREPVRTILSGPAGGVIAATRIAGLIGEPDILTFDMGGTSTDVALCQGSAKTTSEARIIGLPVAVPVLDIHTVGAGGGSLADVDAGGALHVGPASAGADPGPACYGKGTQATVTDANFVLGRFGTTGLLGGAMKLDGSRALEALAQLAEKMSVASRRKVSLTEAGLGVIRVVNTNMEAALRMVSIQRGHDPRRVTLVSFGGAGGLHAAALASALQIPKVIIPETPGAFSALGVLLAEVVRDYSQTVMMRLETTDTDLRSETVRRLEKYFARLERNAVQELRQEGFKSGQMRMEKTLAMRYVGQSFEIDVSFNQSAPAATMNAFHQAHFDRYGHSDRTQPVEVVSVRLRGTGIAAQPAIHPAQKFRTHRPEPQDEFPVYLTRRARRIPVYARQQLQSGALLCGPALVTEYGSTTLIPTEWQVKVDGWRNMILTTLRKKG